MTADGIKLIAFFKFCKLFYLLSHVEIMVTHYIIAIIGMELIF